VDSADIAIAFHCSSAFGSLFVVAASAEAMADVPLPSSTIVDTIANHDRMERRLDESLGVCVCTWRTGSRVVP
jgi:hypothetical protein